MVKSKGAKRGKNRKATKKRVAAHIKAANGKRDSGDGAPEHRAPLLAPPLGVGRPNAGNKRPRESAVIAPDPGRAERDRAEATAYLSAWKAARTGREAAEVSEGSDEGTTVQQGGTRWKFNKNTQGWLLRSMFSEDEMNEDSFETMCLYLDGLKGGGRQRVLAQAQEIIDKHGPDEEEEEEAADEPPQEKTPQDSKPRTGSETVDFDDDGETEPPAGKTSGYNSDSSQDSSDSKGSSEIDPNVSGNSTKDSSKSKESNFSFLFSDEGATKSEKALDTADGEGLPKAKHQRKAIDALTGDAKAQLKAKLAAVAFDRALKVAEVLA